jgi:multiple sugar transport system substrate-binding protein
VADEHEVDQLFSEDEANLDRRELLHRAAAAGLALPTISILASAGSAFARTTARPLTPTFYQWIYNIHPDIPGKINKQYSRTHKLDAKISPVQGFGIERFVAEAKQKKSTWDVYVGMTPFVEMAQLIASGVIEPWDKYLPASVKRDIIPSILKEVSYQGHIWSWPFLLDIIVQARNAEIVQKAGLDPERNPKTWDELISMAKTVVDKKAAPFGVTFDAHGWRSLGTAL